MRVARYARLSSGPRAGSWPDGPGAMISITVLSVIFGACDPYHGITHRADLQEMPNLVCIRRVLDQTPGIEAVNYLSRDGGRTHVFFYQGGDKVRANLVVSIDGENRITFVQHVGKVGRRLPAAITEATSAVMVEVERELEVTCGMEGLQARLEREGN